eukprot:GHUV01024940.1.p1 GENE.GHUV01024940.1~~GHUV01024940.1.p1  ORF type:complete len:144 (+),score=17.76 GHUV01024940.1:644-1075(+)
MDLAHKMVVLVSTWLSWRPDEELCKEPGADTNVKVDGLTIPIRALLRKARGGVSWALRGYLANLKQRPAFMLLPSILVFCLLCSAASFRLRIEKATVTPLTFLAILIQQNPMLGALESAFPDVASKLLASVNQGRTAVQELQV